VAHVTVRLPKLLEDILRVAEVEVEAATLHEALLRLVAKRRALEIHLFDESHRLRKHVLCFLNGTNTRWLAGGDRILRDGDTITILQAVSGG
jgi:molybdopterin converting factor small subunit